MNKKNNIMALTFVVVIGFVIFYVGTDGFTAFTAETARINQLSAEQPSIPAVTLEDSEGSTYPFSALADKYVFITFFYTACDGVCPQLIMNMDTIYEGLPEQHIGEDIVFLSISFDTERDTPYILNSYRQNFSSDEDSWIMARIPDEQELDTLLDQLGVIAIPDGKGHYTHNSAFYLVDPQGTLVNVLDFTETDEATDYVQRILAAEEGV